MEHNHDVGGPGHPVHSPNSHILEPALDGSETLISGGLQTPSHIHGTENSGQPHFGYAAHETRLPDGTYVMTDCTGGVISEGMYHSGGTLMHPRFGYQGTCQGIPNCTYSSDGYVYSPSGYRIDKH